MKAEDRTEYDLHDTRWNMTYSVSSSGPAQKLIYQPATNSNTFLGLGNAGSDEDANFHPEGFTNRPSQDAFNNMEFPAGSAVVTFNEGLLTLGGHVDTASDRACQGFDISFPAYNNYSRTDSEFHAGFHLYVNATLPNGSSLEDISSPCDLRMIGSSAATVTSLASSLSFPQSGTIQNDLHTIATTHASPIIQPGVSILQNHHKDISITFDPSLGRRKKTNRQRKDTNRQILAQAPSRGGKEHRDNTASSIALRESKGLHYLFKQQNHTAEEVSFEVDAMYGVKIP